MTKDDIIRMARQICDVAQDRKGRLEYEMDSYGLVAFANLVAAAEREACAVLCDRGDPMFKPALTQFDCADLIRARGQG